MILSKTILANHSTVQLFEKRSGEHLRVKDLHYNMVLLNIHGEQAYSLIIGEKTESATIILERSQLPSKVAYYGDRES
jgi:hypothetical protein